MNSLFQILDIYCIYRSMAKLYTLEFIVNN